MICIHFIIFFALNNKTFSLIPDEFSFHLKVWFRNLVINKIIILLGLNVDVLGYLIEVISGIFLDKFLTTRIFEPFGMKDTYFYLPENKVERESIITKKNTRNSNTDVDINNSKFVYISL